MVPSESLRAEFQPFYAGPPLHWQRYGIVVVNIAALAYGRTTSRKKVPIIAYSAAASRIAYWCIQPSTARVSLGTGTSDGKKRVALQDEYDKNGREAKTRTPRSRGPTAPIDTVTTADLPGPFVSTTRLNQTSGLRVPLLLLRDQSPS